jgi:hypothetical protein
LHLSSENNINCTTLSGFDGDVLSKVLRGQPDIKQEKHHSKYDKSLPEIEKEMTSISSVIVFLINFFFFWSECILLVSIYIRKDKTLIYTNLHSVVTSPCGYSGKGSQRLNLPLNIKINSPLCCINN